MTLELKDYDVLDFINDDQGLASLLNDALETGHGGYIDDMIATLERAKGLKSDGSLGSVGRLVRAADSVGLKLMGVPRAA